MYRTFSIMMQMMHVITTYLMILEGNEEQRTAHFANREWNGKREKRGTEREIIKNGTGIFCRTERD
ncbi:MAG TPA: hypothetical protein VF465_22375 [Flavobacterium sp.]|uniref:hypothetical protein n=1 Tax=Flavobacterium sp. TaxID=239 RepID=UPI002ED106B3